MSKIKCFVHTDLDGVGCAILAYLAFGRENVDVEYCDYKDVDEKVEGFIEDCDLFKSYDEVYITDISVSEDVANMIDILDTSPKRVRLFDHHATALWLNKYEWAMVMTEYLDGTKTSGTELFYLHLELHGYFNDRYAYSHIIENIQKLVSIVRDYDTWRWKELGEEGVVCKQVNDLFYIYGRDKFIAWAIDQIMTFKKPTRVNTGIGELYIDDAGILSTRCSFPRFSKTDIALLDQKQKDIDIYVAEKNKQIVKSVDRLGHKYGAVFAERYFSELGNRLCELNPNLDYIAMVDISRGSVSYRTIRDDLDLGGEIAHAYGGGGHPKAAGSTFDGDAVRDTLTELIFEEGCMSSIIKSICKREGIEYF